MRELIYVDQNRLDSYARQVEPGGAVVKVPKWVFGWSLTGPNVGGERQQNFRPRVIEEKIDLLLKHLKKNSELAEGRISDGSYFNNPPVFRYETNCTVVGVDLPRPAISGEPGT